MNAICVQVSSVAEDEILDGDIFHVAGARIATRVSPIELAAFRAPGELPCAGAVPAPSDVAASARFEAFSGCARVGETDRLVACSVAADGYRLEIEDVGAVSISLDGLSIRFAGPTATGVDDAAFRDAFLGPVLTLTLALHGTFCLHASAVATTRGVVAFMGSSGAGKSTLARLLAGLPSASAPWRLVADDILPWSVDGGRPVALPRFPQLKLAPDAQPSLALPERLPLVALYELAAPAPESPRGSIESTALSGRAAALGLVRRTVAARLFGPGLLARHLELCATAAEGARVGTLTYPRSMDVGLALRTAIARDLGIDDA